MGQVRNGATKGLSYFETTGRFLHRHRVGCFRFMLGQFRDHQGDAATSLPRRADYPLGRGNILHLRKRCGELYVRLDSQRSHDWSNEQC